MDRLKSYFTVGNHVRKCYVWETGAALSLQLARGNILFECYPVLWNCSNKLDVFAVFKCSTGCHILFSPSLEALSEASVYYYDSLNLNLDFFLPSVEALDQRHCRLEFASISSHNMQYKGGFEKCIAVVLYLYSYAVLC